MNPKEFAAFLATQSSRCLDDATDVAAVLAAYSEWLIAHNQCGIDVDVLDDVIRDAIAGHLTDKPSNEASAIVKTLRETY